MDGLSRYKVVEYDVVSSLPWAPQWHARIEGDIDEFLYLNRGVQTPGPLTSSQAEAIARSYRVVRKRDGTEKVVDFKDVPVARTARTLTLTLW